MKPFYWLLIGFGFLALELTLYLVNPLHTASTELIVRLYGLRVYQQVSQAMLPSIPEGRFILVSPWPYVRHSPEPEDIIAFQSPANPSVEYAKRIIAVGGQIFEIRNCVVFLNGKPLPEPYVEPARATRPESCDWKPVEIPQNDYLVMGDNRDDSEDSRSWGFVPRDRIVGKVVW